MAVFIDADNLNDATALDRVLTDLRLRAERLLYKRAYGRVDSLKGIESVLWRHGVRPVSNMIVNKVTTDSALVIDAVEAVCTQDIDTVAICSGDADFVPLATWVRERGCHVLCFSLSHKIFANPESFYDEVILLEVVEKVDSLSLSGEAASAPEVVDVEPFESTQSETPRDGIHLGGGFKGDCSTPIPLPSSQALIEKVLEALPTLRNGQRQHLGQVVATLRQRGILGKTTKTSDWFAKLGNHFRLIPANKPNQIVYISDARLLSEAQASTSISGVSVEPLPEMVQRVLKAVPDLRRGQQVLSQVVPVLRQKTLIGKTAKSTTFFAQFPSHFKLSPRGQPTHVVYVGPSAESSLIRSCDPKGTSHGRN